MTLKSSALPQAGLGESLQDLATATSVEEIFPFVHLHTQAFDLDNFHVALVPIGASSSRHRAIGDARSDPSRFLFLALTWKELMLRLGNSALYSNHSNIANVVRFGVVTVDLASMEVRRSNTPVNLTAMEFKVLKYLVAHPNRVISRNDLLDQVWGYNNYPCTRTVDNHILRLRQKLEPDLANPVYFRTVHGIGYKFTPSTGREFE